ncbi:MAG: GDSL-type esterase/lipase family protein, partial [Sedimenticola sp.]|nr:GDSL-type esterase/lipase family protein [Sedimenticola sp.]
TSFLDISNTRGEKLESVGKVYSNVEINDKGLIKIKGRHVALHKLSPNGKESLVDTNGWLVTSDNGIIKDGYLYFHGRADDIINCGGIKISPDLLEMSILRRLNKDKGIAVSKISDHIRGDGVLITYLTSLSCEIERIKTEAKDILSSMNIYIDDALHYNATNEIPVTITGKIQRNILSKQYEHQHIENTKRIVSHKTDLERASLKEIISNKLGIETIKPNDSVIGLGIDSLALVSASIEIDEYLGFLPDNWMTLSFNQLEMMNNSPVSKNSLSKLNRQSIYTIFFIVLFFIIGELFLQVRSHYKTGRSAFNLMSNKSTVIFNENYNVKTYRPLLKTTSESTDGNEMMINSYGLRSPEISLTPQDELRIAVVGASTVAGAYAKNNRDTFSQILATMLEEKLDKKVNVINGGIEGLTLAEIGRVTENIIFPMNPSSVIIYTGFNDITGVCRSSDNERKDGWKAPVFNIPNWSLSKKMIRQNTTFLRALKVNSTNYINPDSIDLSGYRSKLENIVLSIIKRKITPVLITNARSYNNVPKNQKAELAATSLYYYYCLDLKGIINIGTRYNDIIRDISKKHGVQLIDLERIMPGGKEYFVDGGHFTLKGEHLVAGVIFDSLKIAK